MDETLKTAAAAAMERLTDHAAVVELANTDESTFRSFFLYELKRLLPNAQAEIEWKRVDLLIRHAGHNTLIEFKYFQHSRSMRVDGSPARWKGGPGPKNEQEFYECITQLHECYFTPVEAKYLILAYERNNPRKSKYCFGRSYGQLTAEGPILEISEVSHRMEETVACKLLRIA